MIRLFAECRDRGCLAGSAGGELKILKSPCTGLADAGPRPANPMQRGGCVEGGVAYLLGATLYEEMVIDEGGRRERKVSGIPDFAILRRHCRRPRCPLRPDPWILATGQMDAKSMRGSLTIPSRPAMGNAIANATASASPKPRSSRALLAEIRQLAPPHRALDLAVRLIGRQEHVVVVVEPESNGFIRMKCMFGQAMLISMKPQEYRTKRRLAIR